VGVPREERDSERARAREREEGGREGGRERERESARAREEGRELTKPYHTMQQAHQRLCNLQLILNQ